MFQSRPGVGNGGKLTHLPAAGKPVGLFWWRQVDLVMEIPAHGTGL